VYRVPTGIVMLALTAAQAHIAWSTGRVASLLTCFFCGLLFTFYSFAATSDDGLLRLKAASQRMFTALFIAAAATTPLFFLLEDYLLDVETLRAKITNSFSHDLPSMVLANVLIGLLVGSLPLVGRATQLMTVACHIVLMDLRILHIAVKTAEWTLCMTCSPTPWAQLIGWWVSRRIGRGLTAQWADK